MSQEILDKLDTVISLLQQLVTRQDKNAPQPPQPSHFSNSEVLIEMVKSADWPEAVPGDLICSESDTDKQERAEGIIEMMLPPNITKFLDFGCGEGHVPEKLSSRVSAAVGYDIIQQGNKQWEEQQGSFLLTTSLDKVVQQGPYDTILIYDVLDHVKHQPGVLGMAKSVLAPGGKVYLRTHPWAGRHGGHLYRELNKAFVHFLLTDEELKTFFGINQLDDIVRANHPIGTYRSCINLSGLQTEQENIPVTIDHYFENNVIQQRLKEIYRDSIAKGWGPEWGYDFCDYVLTH